MAAADASAFSADSHDPLPSGWGVPLSLLVLAGPIVATMVSRTVMNFIDFIMVSQLGTEAQAAIMPAGMTLFCVIALGMGVLTVTNTFVSQALGRGELSECSSYTWQGVWLALGIGLLVLPVWAVVPGFFRFVGHAPAVVAMETDYVRIGLLSIAPTLVGVAVSNFFNGIHKPAIGFWSAVIANVFNVVGNYALIFGHWGFPALGIGGAAWATSGAAAVQAGVLVAWWLRPACDRAYASRAAWRPDAGRLWRTIRIGLPVGLQFVADIASFTVFTLFLVGRFGTVQLAAHNLVFKFLEVSFMPVFGLSVAVTAAVGKSIGRGRPDYARLVTRWALGIAMLYMGSLALSYVAFRHDLPMLLTDADDPNAPAVVAWSSRLLLLCAAFQLFDACGITMTGALRGAGDTVFPAVAGVTASLTVLIGGGIVAAYAWPEGGALGPWMAATVYICIVGVTMAGRWWFGPWERIQLFDSASA